MLAIKATYTNWDSFATANHIGGWDNSTAVCQWVGVTCNSTSGRVIALCAPLLPFWLLPYRHASQAQMPAKLGVASGHA